MRVRAGIKEVLWMAAGALLLALLALVAHYVQGGSKPAGQAARKAHELGLVTRMQLGLTSAAEAEKSAVLATTDEESQKLADQARADTAAVDRLRGELEALLAQTGTPEEKNLLGQFTESFAEFQRIDKDLLALAVQNTNVKASGLAFGPAAAAAGQMDAALAHLAGQNANALPLADQARIAAWRLLSLIPPHIAEESDQKMHEMEARMAQEDKQVRQALDGLAAMPGLADSADLKTAIASYDQFSQLKAQILKLSRENSNVRSASLSLNQKRKVMGLCQAALTALHEAIAAQPAGVHYDVKAR
jgi:hypothetical protein